MQAQPGALPPAAGPGMPMGTFAPATPPAGATITTSGAEILPPPFPWWALVAGLAAIALIGRK